MTPWLKRRVIPIGSYIIATEEIPADLLAKLFPVRRVLGDTRRLVYYYRVTPDGRRVLFGGRVSLTETDPLSAARCCARNWCASFPNWRPTGSATAGAASSPTPSTS